MQLCQLPPFEMRVREESGKVGRLEATRDQESVSHDRFPRGGQRIPGSSGAKGITFYRGICGPKGDIGCSVLPYPGKASV